MSGVPDRNDGLLKSCPPGAGEEERGRRNEGEKRDSWEEFFLAWKFREKRASSFDFFFVSSTRAATKRVYRKCYLYAVSGTRGNYVYDWIDKADIFLK